MLRKLDLQISTNNTQKMVLQQLLFVICMYNDIMNYAWVLLNEVLNNLAVSKSTDKITLLLIMTAKDIKIFAKQLLFKTGSTNMLSI